MTIWCVNKCLIGCRKEGRGSEICHVKKIVQSKNPFIQQSQSGECTETASVQTTSPDAESVEFKNLSLIV